MKRMIVGGAVAAATMALSLATAQAATCKPDILNGLWMGNETVTTAIPYFCAAGLTNGKVGDASCINGAFPQKTAALAGRLTVGADCSLSGAFVFERPDGNQRVNLKGFINPKTKAITLRGAKGGRVLFGRVAGS